MGPLELGSIKYATIYCNFVLVRVMGHKNCGAFSTLIQEKTQDIEAVASLIQPAVKATEKQKGNRTDNTIKMNTKMVAYQLRKSPV